MFLEGKNPVSILNELYPGINFTVVSSQVRLRNFLFSFKVSNFFFLLRIALNCCTVQNTNIRTVFRIIGWPLANNDTEFRLGLERKYIFPFSRKTKFRFHKIVLSFPFARQILRKSPNYVFANIIKILAKTANFFKHIFAKIIRIFFYTNRNLFQPPHAFSFVFCTFS